MAEDDPKLVFLNTCEIAGHKCDAEAMEHSHIEPVDTDKAQVQLNLTSNNNGPKTKTTAEAGTSMDGATPQGVTNQVSQFFSVESTEKGTESLSVEGTLNVTNSEPNIGLPQ